MSRQYWRLMLCALHTEWHATTERRYHWHWAFRPSSTELVVAFTASAAGLQYVNTQVVEIFRPWHVPCRPADVCTVWWPQWIGLDGDGLTSLYDDVIVALLDLQVPLRTTTCRRRPSNAWYDDECRSAKRALRSLEHAARRAGPLSDSTSAVLAWRAERRRYFNLVRRRRSEFWTARITADQSQPHSLSGLIPMQKLGCFSYCDKAFFVCSDTQN